MAHATPTPTEPPRAYRIADEPPLVRLALAAFWLAWAGLTLYVAAASGRPG